MIAAEISLAFAREVAGYPDAFWAGDYLDCGSAQRLPDYTKDWNAVIAALEQRGMSWGTEYIGGQKYFWVESGSLFESEEGPLSPQDHQRWGPSALCLAAIKCVRESKG